MVKKGIKRIFFSFFFLFTMHSYGSDTSGEIVQQTTEVTTSVLSHAASGLVSLVKFAGTEVIRAAIHNPGAACAVFGAVVTSVGGLIAMYKAWYGSLCATTKETSDRVERLGEQASSIEQKVDNIDKKLNGLQQQTNALAEGVGRLGERVEKNNTGICGLSGQTATLQEGQNGLASQMVVVLGCHEALSHSVKNLQENIQATGQQIENIQKEQKAQGERVTVIDAKLTVLTDNHKNWHKELVDKVDESSDVTRLGLQENGCELKSINERLARIEATMSKTQDQPMRASMPMAEGIPTLYQAYVQQAVRDNTDRLNKEIDQKFAALPPVTQGQQNSLAAASPLDNLQMRFLCFGSPLIVQLVGFLEEAKNDNVELLKKLHVQEQQLNIMLRRQIVLEGALRDAYSGFQALLYNAANAVQGLRKSYHEGSSNEKLQSFVVVDQDACRKLFTSAVPRNIPEPRRLQHNSESWTTLGSQLGLSMNQT